MYLLDKSIISGEQIENASSGLDQQRGEYVVDLRVQERRRQRLGGLHRRQRRHPDRVHARLAGGQRARRSTRRSPAAAPRSPASSPPDSARELANVLKYGSLPLSFESSEAETVSATLGLTSLRAGLIAGAIGLALVLLYSLLYYRVLGLLTALSLVASGAMVFAILVLLGRYIGYTLDLAGIAGLIIGIGTTADSFVVFFERIKDEIREGRSFRSAVPRGWARARKTILSGNAVTLPGRRGALRPGRRTGQGLRVHARPDHHPRRRRGVPGDLAAGVPGVEVGDCCPSRRSTASARCSRSRANAGPPRRRREGGSDMAKHESKDDDVDRCGRTRLELDAADDCRGTGVRRRRPRRRHGFFVRLYTGTGAFDVIGKRKLWFGISGAIIADRASPASCCAASPSASTSRAAPRCRCPRTGAHGPGDDPAGRGRLQQDARQGARVRGAASATAARRPCRSAPRR